VKLVVEKEREIQNFKPEESWKISAVLEKDNKKFTTLLTKQSGKTKKIKTEEDAQKFLSTL
jgi:DNA topoisomerase-1